MPAAVKVAPREHPVTKHESGRLTYPWGDLSVGDFFHATIPEERKTEPFIENQFFQNFQVRVHHQLPKRFPNRKFMVMRLDDGVRVQRVK